MNRCIQCYRCVRFYRDYAGGRDLNVLASRSAVYFGRHADGPLESEFAGNLVEVCPTGTFTDKTLKRHYARKWDLQTAPSVCIHCGVGCNTIAGERYGTLRRILNRYNGEINGYFLCDRGRFGYEFVNHERRIRGPLVPSKDPSEKDLDGTTCLQRLGADLSQDGTGVIGIGSPRASLEANFAVRAFVGDGNFYSGLIERDHRLIALIIEILTGGRTPAPSLAEVESSDAVFILGEDVSDTAPRLALALHRSVRQRPMVAARRLKIPDWDAAAVLGTIQEERGPLFVATPGGDPSRRPGRLGLSRRAGRLGTPGVRRGPCHPRGGPGRSRAHRGDGRPGGGHRPGTSGGRPSPGRFRNGPGG